MWAFEMNGPSIDLFYIQLYNAIIFWHYTRLRFGSLYTEISWVLELANDNTEIAKIWQCGRDKLILVLTPMLNLQYK